MLLIVWRESADPDVYETARTNRLFNGVIPERYPVAIAFAKSEQDIVDAVNTAIQKNHRVSVRAGGHSYAAWSLRSDALLLDLGQYVEMDLDEDSGIVCASPGVTGGQLNAYLSARDRAFSVGHCPDVALGGFLLGGGMGWNTNVSCLASALF
jgi:FAD/FMN-containing dehydrogenase